MRNPPKIIVEDQPGSQYTSQEEAQMAALDDLSKHLVQILQDLLADGQLVNQNGKITLATNR